MTHGSDEISQQYARELARQVDELEAEIERLRTALQTIHDTFARDHAQGYKTKDKQFAIDIAWSVLCHYNANEQLAQKGE